MLEDAGRLSPPALQHFLKRYRAEVLRGMSTRLPEAEAGHFQNPDGSGRLVEGAAEAMRAAHVALQAGEALRRVAYRLGRVAHLVADLNDPLASDAADAREPLYAADFEHYVERILPKIRRTLEPRAPGGLDPDSLRVWARQAVEHSRQFYGPIARSYWVDGKLADSRAFDERSIPFGIGALAYSRAVNDLALAWAAIWRESGGDASGSLYERLMGGGQRAAAPAVSGEIKK